MQAIAFWYYQNLINGVRFDSVEDLTKIAESIDYTTPEGVGFAMAIITTFLYLSWNNFTFLMSNFQNWAVGTTNLARVEYPTEGKATLYSYGITFPLEMSPEKPPEINLLNLALAVFGEDALSYRAVRVAFNYLEHLIMRFSRTKDVLLSFKPQPK